MAQHHITGAKGEAAALAHLLKLGYRLECKNWRHKQLEVDLIMSDEKTLIFVEVKTRSSGNFGLPYESVNWHKQHKLAKAANIFIHQIRYQGEIRFVVVSIFANQHNEFNIRHIKDAFWPRYS